MGEDGDFSPKKSYSSNFWNRRLVLQELSYEIGTGN